MHICVDIDRWFNGVNLDVQNAPQMGTGGKKWRIRKKTRNWLIRMHI